MSSVFSQAHIPGKQGTEPSFVPQRAAEVLSGRKAFQVQTTLRAHRRWSVVLLLGKYQDICPG